MYISKQSMFERCKVIDKVAYFIIYDNIDLMVFKG